LLSPLTRSRSLACSIKGAFFRSPFRPLFTGFQCRPGSAEPTYRTAEHSWETREPASRQCGVGGPTAPAQAGQQLHYGSLQHARLPPHTSSTLLLWVSTEFAPASHQMHRPSCSYISSHAQCRQPQEHRNIHDRGLGVVLSWKRAGPYSWSSTRPLLLYVTITLHAGMSNISRVNRVNMQGGRLVL